MESIRTELQNAFPDAEGPMMQIRVSTCEALLDSRDKLKQWNEFSNLEDIDDITLLYQSFRELQENTLLGHAWLYDKPIHEQLAWLFQKAKGNDDYEDKIACMDLYGVNSHFYDHCKREHLKYLKAGKQTDFALWMERAHILQKVEVPWFHNVCKVMQVPDVDVGFFNLIYKFARPLDKARCRKLVMTHLALLSSETYELNLLTKEDVDPLIRLKKGETYYSAMMARGDLQVEANREGLKQMFAFLWQRRSGSIEGKKNSSP